MARRALFAFKRQIDGMGKQDRKEYISDVGDLFRTREKSEFISPLILPPACVSNIAILVIRINRVQKKHGNGNEEKDRMMDGHLGLL